MAYIWYEPRKKQTSVEPRITISQQFIALNKALFDSYFEGSERVRIGFDKEKKELILLPLKKDDKRGIKIIFNEKSPSYKYINAGRLFRSFELIGEDQKINLIYRGDYKCTWDPSNKGVVINLEKDKI